MPKINPASLGVVLSGGGTRSAYAVGALRALAEVHGIEEPAFMCSMSGSAGPKLFYLARRYDDMYEWSWRFDDPRLISWTRFWRGPIMDIHFLIDGILSQQAPALPCEVAKTKTKYFIAATRLPEGTPHWFTREDHATIFGQLKATKMISGVAQWWTDVRGEQYADGCLSVTVADAVEKLYREGAERVLVIDNSTHGRMSRFTQALMRFGVRKAPEYLRKVIERECSRVVRPLEPRERLIICRRETLPARHGLTRASRLLKATIDAGYADMASLEL